MPPQRFEDTCGKRWDLPTLFGVLFVKLEFLRLLNPLRISRIRVCKGLDEYFPNIACLVLCYYYGSGVDEIDGSRTKLLMLYLPSTAGEMVVIFI